MRARSLCRQVLLAGAILVAGCAASGFRESDPDFLSGPPFDPNAPIGGEISAPKRLRNGQELEIGVGELLRHGELLFLARWTSQEGQGRAFGRGDDGTLTDPSSPLTFPRAFNRISGPAAGSCFGCHNMPRAGGGDVQGPVFVLGNRFDFVTFDRRETMPQKSAFDETGKPITLQTVSNPRKSTGMFGSGFIEMLARQITAELQSQAAACAPGKSCALRSKGIDFGTLTRRVDGTWDVSQVAGLPAPSLRTSGATPPSLIIQPFFQSGAVISLRQFSNNAYTRLHGVQSEERFGNGIDQDRDGFVNELTRADMTAVSVYQAALPAPGQVIPRDPRFRAAIAAGERLFESTGCAGCHIPRLPLTDKAWVYSEPNPYNPPGNLRLSDGVRPVSVDLTSAELPWPRLKVEKGAVMVPAYTDLKLHDITSGLPSCIAHPELINTGQCDGDVEALDQNEPAGTPAFFAGNRKYLTRKLWGIANQHSFGHHGQYTTLREAVLAHAGEAAASSAAFRKLDENGQNALIEFLKSLQILPPGTPCLIVDENYSCGER